MLSTLPVTTKTLRRISFHIDCVCEESIHLVGVDPKGFLDEVVQNPVVAMHMERWDGELVVRVQRTKFRFSDTVMQVVQQLDWEMKEDGRFEELVCSEWRGIHRRY
jgi:hypothetical protein